MRDPRFESPRDAYGTMIEPPTAGARTRVLTWGLAAAAAGGAALLLLQRLRPALEVWVTADPVGGVDRLMLVLVSLAATADLPLVLGALYFWRLGGQTLQSGRFPPAGAMLLRPTPVLTGDAARRRGRAAQLFAVGLIACSMLLVTLLVWLAVLAGAGNLA